MVVIYQYCTFILFYTINCQNLCLPQLTSTSLSTTTHIYLIVYHNSHPLHPPHCLPQLTSTSLSTTTHIYLIVYHNSHPPHCLPQLTSTSLSTNSHPPHCLPTHIYLIHHPPHPSHPSTNLRTTIYEMFLTFGIQTDREDHPLCLLIEVDVNVSECECKWM
jgi:hypothetical protein